MTPCSRPGPASSSAYRRTRGRASPKSSSASEVGSAGVGSSTGPPVSGAATSPVVPGPSEALFAGVRSRCSGVTRAARALAVPPVHARDGVVHDLALERRHGTELLALAALLDLLGRPAAQLGQLRAPVRPPARDVEHQPVARPGALLHRQAGELLERLEDVPALADQLLEVLAAVDAHDGAAGLHVEVDVAVEVEGAEG